jgi:hypothetical protein
MFSGRSLAGQLTAASAAAITVILAGCSTSGSAATSATSATNSSASGPAASQAPLPAESNPPGDIPDTTVYVPYRSAKGHVAIKVPEGWARQNTAASSTFTSNLNSISVAWQPMTSAPTMSTARSVTVPHLSHAALAFRLQSVKAVTLPGGPAVEIVYEVNSPPNAVTGRQYRLVIERFEFYKNGRSAVLSLSSTVGSDNVDPWRIVSDSFRWA